MKSIILFLLLLTTSRIEAETSVTAFGPAYPGEPLRFLVSSDEKIEDISVDIVSARSGDSVTGGQGFPLGSMEEKNLFFVISGIPVSAAEGTYIARVDFLENDETKQIEQYVKVEQKEFRSEDIPLNENMSTLRESDEPRKIEEARELTALLYTFNTEGYYHEEAMLMPLKDIRVTSYFGDRRTFLYADESTAHSIHTGIDLAGSKGTEVHACGRGRIVMAKERVLTGFTVVIEHLPGVYSLYYHLDALLVERGQKVEAGTVIGSVGSTGLVTGPHLHWELRTGGVAVNPNTFVEKPIIDKEQILSIITP